MSSHPLSKLSSWLDIIILVETQRILAQLRHVKSASLVPRECLAGTRINILGDITEQLMTVSKTPIIWLSGVAGSGKSTIATSISQYFRALGRLGAVIRFARNDVGHSNPIMVLHSIVLGLANAHPDIEQAICKVLAHDYQLLDAAIESQFQELLLGPLDSVKQHIVGPFIVIIDAVDECATNFREDMINLIAKLFPKLPTAIRLLVTARPDADITSGFGNASTIYQHRLTTEPEDISLYIHNRLDIIRQKHNLDSWWPGKDRVTHLVSLSGNLFIWAVTALNFVGERTAFYPPKRLDTLLHTPFREDNLNQLYTLALESNGDWNDLEFKESATLILATIALSKLSLTDRAIDSILGFTNDFTARVLRHFGAVIEWSPEQPAQILHASFGDFLLHPSDKTNPWFFEIAEANKILTSGCLTLLQKCLRFNIYDFPDSHLLNSEVPGLGESPLPVGLIYASRFWGSHLGNTKYDGKIVELLEGFLRNKFLFWLEIVSVQQEISSAESTLMLAQKYIHGKYQTIEMFLQDARKFISVFAPVISQSAPHIYVSALPLTPRDSVVRQYFLSLFPHLLQYTVPNSWVKLEKVLWGHTDKVTCVALSPNGELIVSGSHDHALRMWEASSGAPVGNPLQGPTRPVISLAFSADGQYIISVTDDRTVQIWDARSRAPIGDPLPGCTGYVNCVAFSPDGQHIVSASFHDQTMQIWDTSSGAPIGNPLQGHTEYVSCVAFSPDGQRIVSASHDKTVQIWDASSGAPIGNPLQGHTGEVSSVAFSPDGQQIASGSWDTTVRIWDASSGAPIGNPLQGHTDIVYCVAFSPDGQQIVSGSWDTTVRIWDTHSGAPIGGPLQGHTGWVYVVAFSPDGQHIVSGSDDKTVQIWDADTSAPLGDPLQGHLAHAEDVEFSTNGQHILSLSDNKTMQIWDTSSGAPVGHPLHPLRNRTGWVTSVALSPNGQCIAFGLNDHTVRIWETSTGTPLTRPLKGHTQSVTSIAFSPDGQRIVSGSWDKILRIWDPSIGGAVGHPLKGHTDSVSSVAFSPDGQCIVSGSDDKTVRIWDASSGAPIGDPLKGHTSSVTSVAFSPDGQQIISGSRDRTVRIWDAGTCAPIGDPLLGCTESVSCVAFSPDGQHIVSGSGDKVRIWDTHTGACIGVPFQGHTAFIGCVTFLPDGQHIVSGSTDGIVRIWDACIGASKPDDHMSELSVHLLPKHPDTFEDGWISSAAGRLIWVPCFLQSNFCLPWCKFVITPHGVMALDLSKFVHGTEWAKCMEAYQ
ncbi:quinon protein alcohol dehydrogenase-like superfamily [Favolaschia claudopus]|uniref:Quinon protein alcohol dehydrogenase-like superfamily n=1 Tax=Favolaschia claudopus TaxID=2862362 RepID=A0AAV9ZMS2_9AGAR